jgi:hypothetical protein
MALPKTLTRAVARSRSMIFVAFGAIWPPALIECHHSAATPATCGQAMLVPESERSPPPTLAERIPTPGALTCGKMLENGAMPNPLPSSRNAPTEITPSAAAGGEAAILNFGS